jgi:hypothetical protein
MPNPAQPTDPAQQALVQLQKYYFYLNDNFDSLTAKCTTDDQRTALKTEFIVARDAYLKAQNQALADNDGVLAGMTKQLADLQSQIKAAIASAQSITKILQTVATASGVAAKIVTVGT